MLVRYETEAHYVRVQTLFGRSSEIRQLTDVIAGSSRTGGGLVLRGPAGIGKSSVVARLRETARADGYEVLTTAGIQSEARLAFAGLHQLLRPRLGLADRLPPRLREALLTAFGMTEVAAPDPYLISLAALELLAASAAETPVLVVVDDAQWLDAATAEALAFVIRRLGADPLSFVICLRDGYESAFTTLDLAQLNLAELDDTSSAQLLDAAAPHLDPRARERVLAAARGNPLALLELAEATHSPDLLQTHHLHELPMTTRLERAFTSRYDELPAPARSLLLLSAANDSDSLAEILAAAEILRPDADAGYDALDPAVAAGLVTVGEMSIGFRHPLVRSAIYQRATLAARRGAQVGHEEGAARARDR